MILLGTIGLTFILKQGRILNKIRSFLINTHPIIKELFECCMCLGFWVGLISGILCLDNIKDIFILAFSTSFASYFCQILIKFAESYIVSHNPPDNSQK